MSEALKEFILARSWEAETTRFTGQPWPQPNDCGTGGKTAGCYLTQ